MIQLGQIKTPEKVTPIASVFTGDDSMFADVESELTTQLGPCAYKVISYHLLIPTTILRRWVAILRELSLLLKP